MVKRRKTIPFNFGEKHINYIRDCNSNMYNIAEGAIRAGKTVDNVYAFAHNLKTSKDRIHLASGSTMANAKLNIGDANGFGLEYIFRNQSHWGKYKDNEALFIKGPDTKYKQRIVIFSGATKADSYKKIRGNSYGMWIATEVNLHHESFIREAFNRTAAAKVRKFFWDLNPDHPKAVIYSQYIDKYRDKEKEGTLLGGCNYEHFTIDDNVNIPESRKAEIKSQYDPGSIWYLKDIKGLRVVGEGLIYRNITNVVTSEDNYYKITEVPKNLQQVTVGIDFGGSGSSHAFVCSGITRGFQELILLASEKHDADGIDPDQLFELFYVFCLRCVQLFGTGHFVYADSAEQVLINGIRTYFRKKGLGWLPIENALKMRINERINLKVSLASQNRWKYLYPYSESVIEALCSAVWDPKNALENERLDDGTSDIDSLDAYEYTFERYASQFIRR